MTDQINQQAQRARELLEQTLATQFNVAVFTRSVVTHNSPARTAWGAETQDGQVHIVMGVDISAGTPFADSLPIAASDGEGHEFPVKYYPCPQPRH